MWAPTRAVWTSVGLATVGAFVQVFSGYWDVYSHRVFFIEFDPWWNPAHFSLYGGGLILLAGVALWYWDQGRRAFRWPGFPLLLLAAVTQLVATIFNEAWHVFLGEDPPLAPPHVLAVVGMIVAAFGVLVALGFLRTVTHSEGTQPTKMLSRALDGLLLLAFTTMWLVAVGSTVFVGVLLEPGGLRLVAALVVSVVAPLVVVPAARIFGRPGYLTLLGIAITGINWVLIVGYVGDTPYLPIGILPFALVDLVYSVLRPRLGQLTLAVLAGGILGLFYNFTHFPFISGVSWLPTLDLSVLSVTLAGAVGGLLAHGLFERTAAWGRRRMEAGGPGRGAQRAD